MARARPPQSSDSAQASLFDVPAAPPAISQPGLSAPLEAQFDTLPTEWREHLRPFLESEAYGPLCRFVDAQLASGKTVYPADVFRALRLTRPDAVKVVI